jgi:NTP pyrophosphatase (non-canonical NTP hydrolase)
MKENIDLKKYKEFVDGVTSQTSKDTEVLIARIRELESKGANVPRLMTAGIGLASEGGEFDEIVKKIMFQGKEYNEDNIFHMKRELGDIIWYWAQACLALNLDPNEIIAENVRKLESRYPGGTFDVWFSENRKDGDL